jgi:tetratricopeptide (TPR) repeat protein
MDLEAIRGALGLLQQDAESDQAWSTLRETLANGVTVDGAATSDGTELPQVQSLLAAARTAHANRGEWHAVAALMPLEADLCDDKHEKIALLMELGRVRQQELLDEPGAMAIYSRVLEIDPEDEIAKAALAESDERRGEWRDMASDFLREANNAPDDAYKAAMLMRSAEMEWRFADEELDEERLLGMLAQAAEADPKNPGVQRMLERIYRKRGDYRSAELVLERAAKYSEEEPDRVAAALRLARLRKNRLDDGDGAAAAYEQTLAMAPQQTEALEALVEYYSDAENWDKLVQLYERELEHLDLSRPERVGDMLQIAMLHYRKRANLGDAALWFERVRAHDPANRALLEFYRDYCTQNGDEGLLLKVLQGAQRVLPEGPDKQAVTTEIAKLAESQEDAQKAIEQYKALLRQDPNNADARASLKSLYRKTQGYTQLVDLLRHELEGLPDDETEERVRILREVASVYRTHLPSETSLVSALNQILKVAPDDIEAVRELIALYDKLGRGRDLLASQQRLAELTSDPEERASLLRAVGQRWLTQFSNVQNATASFEALLEVVPDDREARDTLRELYRKRRAWPALYALYESEVGSLEGAQRLAVMKEMASLAAERLGQAETAARLYREILEAEPGNRTVLDALEKHAERSKDWKTLADALELRVATETDDAGKVAVLQKLGGVCEDRLGDLQRTAAAWRQVLELKPGFARAVRVLRDIHLGAEDYDGLEQLYVSQGDHEGLAEVLSNAADRASGVRAKVDLSYRAAAVYEDKLQQPERAFRCYERILAADPMDTRAARALIPLYEEDEKWARLPALYELLLADTTEPTEKAALYAKLYEVSSQRLSDRDAAVQYARKAYEAAPGDEAVLGQFFAACQEAQQWEPYVSALEQQLSAPAQADAALSKGKKRKRKGKKGGEARDSAPPPSGLDAGAIRRLELSLAQVYEEQLDRTTEAAATLKRILSRDPTDTEVAGQLERLLRAGGKPDELRWYFGFRVEHAGSEQQRLQCLRDWATVEEDGFSDEERAAELHQRILEADPSNDESVVKLVDLLLALGNAVDATSVIENHKDQVSPVLLGQLEVQLAEIQMDRLRQPEAALEAALRALDALRAAEQHSEIPRAVEVLQRLVEVAETKQRAAAALAEVYKTKDEGAREIDALTVLLDVEKNPARRLEIFTRAIAVCQELETHGRAFELALRACREFPEEITMWDRAGELSERSGRPTELADAYREVLREGVSPDVRRQLCERAASLHEEQLGDPVGATPYLEQVLADDPADTAAFGRLKQILTSAQRWDELRTLYDRTIAATQDAGAKVENLGEVAMICESFTDDSIAAMGYYEAILGIEPEHATALESLDRLYVQHERYQPLAQLLDRRAALSSGEEAHEFRLRMATLLLDRLHEPERAMTCVENILDEDVNNVGARELAERLLQVGSLAVDASKVLERVYEARDEVRDLVRVLEVRRGALTDVEGAEHQRLELLRRIAELKNDRLRDDEGALAAFLELVPLEPTYTEGRKELLEISERLGASIRVADALEAAATNADTLALKGEILMDAARVYETSLGNQERAQELYHQVMVLDPADPDLVVPAARALEQIQESAGDHAALVKTLRVQLQMEHDLEARAALWARVAGLCERELDDAPAAIAAWRSRLEDRPDDADTLEALDRLYAKTKAWRELVGVLDARRRLAEDETERREFMRRTALVHSDELESPADAIEAYRAMVDEFGAEKQTLVPLAKLLGAEARWEELADVLGMLLELASDDAERLALLTTIGDLRREHLSNPGGALEAYREVTETDPQHELARAALEMMLESEDPLNRKEAAEILMALYEADGDDKNLLVALKTLVDAEQDPIDRLQALERAAGVARDRLHDNDSALELTVRAVRDAVGHTDLKPWLDELDFLAKATGQRKVQVDVLRQVVDEIFDGEVQFSVIMSIARLARDELADRELALQFFNRALEVESDSDAALAALEKLYAEADDTEKLLGVLERRAEISPDDYGRKRLLLWRAQLLDEKLQQSDQAIAVYESVLDIELDETAIDALVSLYTRAKRWEALIDLYLRQSEAPGADRAELHIKIGRVALDELGDAARCFDELEAALAENAHHPKAIEEIERLMVDGDDAERHARAAALLEPIYLARGDFDRVMATIEARLEGADSVERRGLLERLAQLHEEQKEDYRAALETIAKLFADDITDSGTVSELERLAKVSDSRSRLVEIYSTELEKVTQDDVSTAQLCRRCGELYGELGQTDRALVFYRRALAFEPESVELFEAVDGILQALEKHEERVELHRKGLDHRFDPDERLSMLHTIAELQNVHLDRKADAIDTYIEALDINPDDPTSLDTLSRLYYETKRYEELVDLVLKRAELATDQNQAIAFRLALAKLCRHELSDAGRAIEQLEEIVRVQPQNPEAIAELESLRKDPEQRQRAVEILAPLYEEADDWRHLIKVNEDRFELAADDVDKVNVLRQTATLWEERGGDASRAMQALVAAIQLEPDNTDVRLEFERLAELTEAWDKLAEVYAAILDRHPDLLGALDYWRKLAQVHDGPRDDPRAALRAYEKVHRLEPTDIEPVERMEALSTLLSDWETLDWVLVDKTELVLDDEERASTWRRVGEGRRDMLNRHAGAVEAYEKALELEPDSAFTLDCLIDLYEQDDNATRLVELYQRRVDIADPEDVDLCYALLVAAAKCYEKYFDDRVSAIDMLNRAAEFKPQDAELLQRLHDLYKAEERWPDLLDNLRAQAEAADSIAGRVKARREMGDVLVAKLESFEDALDEYALVLDEMPGDEAARASVMQLGQQHEDLRERVADVLIPGLITEGAYSQHVDVLEMRLTVEADPTQRAQTLRTAADVLLDKMGQVDEAKKMLLRAVSEVPEDLALHERIEELCQRTTEWGSYADTLSERAQNTFDAELARELYARLGNIAETRLEDSERAIEAYRRAVDQVGDEPALLQALDRLYQATRNWSDLVDVLERRTAIVETDPERAELYYRAAVIQLDEFGEMGQGLGSLRTALDLDPNHTGAREKLESLTDRRELFDEVSEILEMLYRSIGSTDKLAELYGKRVGFAETPGERIEMRRGLAQVLEDELGDPKGAQQVLQQGLKDDPADADLLSEIERLAELSGQWESAADALGEVIAESSQLAPDVGKELCVRQAQWLSDKVGQGERAEAALEKAFELDPNAEDVLVQLEALQGAPGREMARVATMRRRARLQADEMSREDIYKEAVTIADERGEAAVVEQIYRELLAQQPDNPWALRGLRAVRAAAQDHSESFELIMRLLDVVVDADETRRLRHEGAALAREHLGKPDVAASLLERAFEDDPMDLEAATGLRQLLAQLERHRDLAELMERVIEITDAPEERARARVELARMQAERFEEHDTAIDTLRIAIEDDPSCSDAVVFLSRLYEELGKNEQLAELLNEQIAAARERGDVDTEMDLEVRLGEIYESKLEDPAKAIDTYDRVLERNPEHKGALLAVTRLHKAGAAWLDAAARLEQLSGLVEGPERLNICKELAECYLAVDDKARAAGVLETALSLAPEDDEVREQLRSFYEASQEWEKLGELAVADAERVGDDEQKCALWRAAANVFSEKLGDHVRAASLLEQALELEPTDRDLLLQLCDEYSASSRAKEAIDALQKVVESYGGRRSKELGDIHRRLANAFIAEGERESAAAELEKAFRIEPGNVATLTSLGELSLELGNFEQAQRMFRALLLQKESPLTKAQVFYKLGFIEHSLGKKPEALRWLDKALQADADLAEARELAAQLRG